ncbi:heterokaryon incompatibility protein-domain-containing protein [Microdochium trichocladiopsis]|uniref:Heterokaryon incompatibility protein-domain-containing protein n=1 Tax=Microdochium trichocladiopsis TaxID=1682393 RepID=A0A9P8Y7V8_9PEZI|nr:heterokaryon incompatibility protein-domain-containing protein [Microdochium trichocladiopsis]KAH7031483.1 heterokaryon incompatibility protein-domain-containing protein [Microdochium trichocladiopsis]
MRLLNAESMTLEEFFDEQLPEYAILSHTWDKGEVTFQAFQQKEGLSSHAGYHKITESCRLAQARGYKYVWIDTCCIDKSSSAELSEAINSMFRWYENACVCFVYLADVPSWEKDNIHAANSAFRRSRWHFRGWTLQELLAPKMHVFFGSDWGILFNFKHQPLLNLHKLHTLMGEITGIDFSIPWRSASVAKRLSWASSRTTTRKEDIAYCLLGLFDVHLPLLYGEGENAFKRLLVKIVEQDNGHDILSAGYGIALRNMPRKESLRHHLLPQSPLLYGACSSVSGRSRPGQHRTAHFAFTNAGLLIELPLVKILGTNIELAILDCTTDGGSRLIALPLRLHKMPNEFELVPSLGPVDMPTWITDASKVHKIYIRTREKTFPPHTSKLSRTWLDLRQLAEHGWTVTSVYPPWEFIQQTADDVFDIRSRKSDSIIILSAGTAMPKLALLVGKSLRGHKRGVPESCMFTLTRSCSALQFLLDSTWNECLQENKAEPGGGLLGLRLTTNSGGEVPHRKTIVTWTKEIEIAAPQAASSQGSVNSLSVMYLGSARDGVVRVTPFDENGTQVSFCEFSKARKPGTIAGDEVPRRFGKQQIRAGRRGMKSRRRQAGNSNRNPSQGTSEPDEDSRRFVCSMDDLCGCGRTQESNDEAFANSQENLLIYPGCRLAGITTQHL